MPRRLPCPTLKARASAAVSCRHRRRRSWPYFRALPWGHPRRPTDQLRTPSRRCPSAPRFPPSKPLIQRWPCSTTSSRLQTLTLPLRPPARTSLCHPALLPRVSSRLLRRITGHPARQPLPLRLWPTQGRRPQQPRPARSRCGSSPLRRPRPPTGARRTLEALRLRSPPSGRGLRLGWGRCSRQLD